MNSVKKIIETLHLIPHPEGGYYQETYRSSGVLSIKALPKQYGGDRNFSTCIYFLLTADMFSAFHRIHQDEIWHFYNGSPLRLHILSPSGDYNSVVIGNNFDRGETPQFVVSGGTWFAASVENKTGYSLMGCTVAPGFDFQDFELATRDKLLTLFPEHRKVIIAFTKR